MTTLTPFDSRDPVNETKGGTNQSSFTSGDLLYASASNTLSKLSIGSSGQVLTSNGTIPAWATPNAFPTNDQNLSVYCDFFNDPEGTLLQPFSYQSWTFTTDPAVTSGTAANPGVAGTETTGSNYLKMSADHFSIAGSMIIDWVIKIPTLSNGTDRFTSRIGLMNGTTGAPTQGMWFEQVDNVNSGNWTINTVNGGSPTTSNTNSTPDTNFNRYRITVDSGGTTVRFYINGVEVTNSPITTTIPTGFFAPKINFTRSAGTNSRGLQADLMWLQVNLTNPRI